MKIIGITGAIGCGKTTVATIIKELGFDVFDADVEVKKIYQNSDFLHLLKGAFPRVFNKEGCVDKKLLRSIVFCNQKELLKLEDIIEPFLNDVFMYQIKQAAKQKNWLFIDAPLLFEKGWNKYCDKVIAVTADFQTQKDRVMQRDNISEEEFLNIYHLQMENSKKCALADDVIDTQCELNELKYKVIDLIEKLKKEN